MKVEEPCVESTKMQRWLQRKRKMELLSGSPMVEEMEIERERCKMTFVMTGLEPSRVKILIVSDDLAEGSS
jgi:hypothetical protein